MTDTAKTPVPAWKDEDPIFEKVEIEASIDPSVWTYYLLHRLQSFLDTTSENIPTGCYTVKVRFVVEIDGRISSAIALNNPGYGFAKASEEAVREGPRWKPGKTFEGVVRSYHTQPLYFMVENGECGADTTKEAVKPPSLHMLPPNPCEADTITALMFSP